MKNDIYEFIYLDKKGNELTRRQLYCYSKKEAINLSKAILANSMINDLHEIKTRKLPI